MTPAIYQEIFHNAKVAHIIIHDGVLVDCNARAAEDLGYSSLDAVISCPFSDIVPDGYYPPQTWIEDRTQPVHEWKVKRVDGETTLVFAQFVQAKDYLSIQWQTKEDALETLEEKNIYQGAILRAVIDADADLISGKNYCKGDGVYIGANKAFLSFYDLEESQLVGRNDLEIFGEDLGEMFRKHDNDFIENFDESEFEEWVIRPNGEKALLRTTKSILKDEEGNAIGLLNISRDMTREFRKVAELEKSEKTYRKLANTDPLTGIPNRRLFFELARQYFDRALLLRQSISIAMIDVDHFKQINDTYGHTVGDEVLSHITYRFSNRLRVDDLLARYAGDEFVILFPQTDVERAVQGVHALQEVLRETPYVTNNGEEIEVTFSVGVTEWRDEMNFETFLEHADTALYRAKKLGRNRVEVYTADN